MTPPSAPKAREDSQARGDVTAGALHSGDGESPDTGIPLATLTRRAEFLAASRARRQAMPGFILQARRRGPDEPPPPLIRVGFTCSKKVGNAVARNRAKRRLRVLARTILPIDGHGGWDYVLVGRAKATTALPFADLTEQMQKALSRLHGAR